MKKRRREQQKIKAETEAEAKCLFPSRPTLILLVHNLYTTV
jgi:hypothetical protein